MPDETYVLDEIDIEFFWDVIIRQKIIPAERSIRMRQSFDLAVLHLKPSVLCEIGVKIHYSRREWVL